MHIVNKKLIVSLHRLNSDIMHFEELEKGLKKNQLNPEIHEEAEEIYLNAVQNSDLDNLEKNIDILYRFLKKWNPRVKFGKTDEEKKSKLLKVLKKNKEKLYIIKNEKIETFSFTLKNIELVKEIFKSMCETLKPTGTAKILNIINPELFPLWDMKIREAYGCMSNEQGYLNLMILQKNQIMQLLKNYAKQEKINEVEAKKEILQKTYENKKALLKLIDEYNYTQKNQLKNKLKIEIICE